MTLKQIPKAIHKAIEWIMKSKPSKSMRLIENWEELKTVPDSEKYTLDIGEYNGWVLDKETGEMEAYLSTHTFYGSQHEHSTKYLQSCGFNVVLANWDA